ncbi:hypothetical protein V5799_001169 [Amblyomma americanum]|uniref:Uncharacterized protein n=1 Tax=Amblyomma americanum TaxID=6943 RepID=A0AAQ4D0Y9_AMBAM
MFRRSCRERPGFYGPPVHIELKDHAKAVFLKTVPSSLTLNDDVAKEGDRFVQQGIWEPVEYYIWGAPLAVVKKKHGILRLCGDYRGTMN